MRKQLCRSASSIVSAQFYHLRLLKDRQTTLGLLDWTARLMLLRIVEIQLYVSRGDHESYGRLRALINEPKGPPTPSPVQPRTPQSGVPLPPIEPTYTLPNGHPRPPTFPTAMPPRPYTTGSLLSHCPEKSTLMRFQPSSLDSKTAPSTLY